MEWERDPLWRELRDMRIEPEGAGRSFAGRLARENGWSAAHARRVDLEYRRFLYLAATGSGPATPSEEVDQAWHLHLGYSRHYWSTLCGRILKRPLHHDPSEGGASARERHLGQYARTLERYREVFGAEPPKCVWPAPERLYSARPLRIDASRYWLLPRRMARVAGAGLFGGALAILSTSAAASAGEAGGGLAIFLIVPAVAALGLILIARRSRRSRKDGGCGSGCGSSDGDGGDGGGDGGGCGGGCGGGGD